MMVLKNYTLFIILICTSLRTTAQTKADLPFFDYKNEVGINATQLLSNVLSFNNTSTSTTPFGFHYARHYSTFTIRFGANLFYKKTDENTGPNPSNPSGLRSLADHTLGGRLCIEKHIAIMPKVNFHVGIDGTVQNIHDESIVSGQFFTSNNTLQLGAGPAARVLFKINKHLHIMTESTLYGTYGITEKRVQLGTPTPDVTTSNSQGAELSLPTKLFIQLLF
jgi:hypothetical protein